MKTVQFSFLLLATLLMTAACKKKPQASYTTFKIDQVFELKLGGTTQLEDDALKLTFTAVPEDSRCPKGVDCFQAGQVRITLSANLDESDKTLEFVRAAGEKGNVTRPLGNFKIHLMDVSPYPEDGKTIKPGDYKIRLVVRR